MKRYLIRVTAFLFLFAIFIIPTVTLADGGFVTCGGPDCTICNLFSTLANIYNFIVKDIAAPLATIAIVIGALMMMISAGNPNTFNRGKSILALAIVGLVLVFGSWLIINTILHVIGYNGNWASLEINCPPPE